MLIKNEVYAVVRGEKPACLLFIEPPEHPRWNESAEGLYRTLALAAGGKLETVIFRDLKDSICVAVGRRGENALSYLGNVHDFGYFMNQPYAQRFGPLGLAIDGMTVAQAVHHLFVAWIMARQIGIPRPEVSVLLGLLFGYQPCCIRAYVDSFYYGKEWPADPFMSGKLRYIRCENCIRLDFRPPWFTDDGSEIPLSYHRFSSEK